MSNNACFKYDFTLKAELLTTDELKDKLKSICKKWGFQREISNNTEYDHYQGRVSLKEKKRLTTLCKENPGFHWSITSNYINNDNFYDYVEKEDTRIEGPYKDTDIPKLETYQLKIFNKFELYPWQQHITTNIDKFEMRNINLIYDETGNSGKSLFCEYLEYNFDVEEVPPFRLMDDIFQWVCGCPGKKIYIFDMPRGMKKDKLGDFYSGIEIIKNGVAYDKRYTRKKIRFDRPQIYVFTNTLPEMSLMSADRWNVFKINKTDMSLEKFSNCEL